MKEIYDWVPWFRELAKKIETGGETYLIERTKQVVWASENPALLRYGEENLDPFSFFYFLAQKNTTNQRKLVYSSVNEVFEIADEPPETGWESTYIIPTPPSNASPLFHYGENFNPTLLWKLFRQAVKEEPDVQAADFHAALNIKNVKVRKLTQCLFLINPQCFIPIDDCFPDYKNIEDKITKPGGWDICLEEINKTKQKFPGCSLYEIGRVFYLLSRSYISLSQNFFQISTYVYDYGPNDEDDYWRDFEINNKVYTGGPGSKAEWKDISQGKKLKNPFPLKKPMPGEIILVRTGVKQGRAIGIVEHNDYADHNGMNESSSIHVLWINKVGTDTSERMDSPLPGFSDVGTDKYRDTYQAFRNTESYKPTFEFIESRTNNAIEDGTKSYPISKEPEINVMEHHPLNQILYGPPGTGKTWDTVNHTVAIIEGKSVHSLKRKDLEHKFSPPDLSQKKEEYITTRQRFNKYKREGRIKMVTFHQNYAYEDFIEGIRPMLSSRHQRRRYKNQKDKTDITYELSSGVFKKIAKLANSAPKEKKYVLIIDEINRGNIAKIFGELITLIEPSKRLKEDDEITVTLPYSKETFGVPGNLYIIGTMNTADRSIALLDTALRRRFEFIEMMPQYYPNSDIYIKSKQLSVEYLKLLKAMNDRICVLYDRDHQIGHTYFMGLKDIATLASTFKNQIIPLLQEYFYDNWEKIDLVLNKNGFVQASGVDRSLFQSSDLVDTERTIYELLPANDEKWLDPKSYIQIYQTKEQSSQEGQNN